MPIQRLIGEQSEVVYGDAPPTTGYWFAGAQVINSASRIGSPAGWVCVTSGAPGTWAILPNGGYGWHDILGPVVPKASGAGSPTRTAYAGGNVYDWAFAVNNVSDFTYHIPHDFVPYADDPTSQIHLHVHWSHNGTNISGTVEFT